MHLEAWQKIPKQFVGNLHCSIKWFCESWDWLSWICVCRAWFNSSRIRWCAEFLLGQHYWFITKYFLFHFQLSSLINAWFKHFYLCILGTFVFKTIQTDLAFNIIQYSRCLLKSVLLCSRQNRWLMKQMFFTCNNNAPSERIYF